MLFSISLLGPTRSTLNFSQSSPGGEGRGGRRRHAMPCHAVVSWVSSALLSDCAKVSSPICHSGILFAGGLAWPHSGTAGREGGTYETDRDGDLLLLLLWCWSCGASKLKESNLEVEQKRPTSRSLPHDPREDSSANPSTAQRSTGASEGAAGGRRGGTPLLLISPPGRTGRAAADPSC
jgi:hypothetical protein